MKNCILTIAGLLLTTTLAFAQPEQGSLYFSGQLGFSSSNTSQSAGNVTVDNNPKSSSYIIAPAIGYTVTDNILAGVRFSFEGSKTESVDFTGERVTTKASILGVALFGRYYLPLSDNFFFYPELNVGFGSASSETSSGGTTIESPNTNIFAVGVTPGLAFYPTSNWGIELSAGFIGFTSASSKNENTDPTTESKTSDFTFSLDALSVNVGVSYLLPL